MGQQWYIVWTMLDGGCFFYHVPVPYLIHRYYQLVYTGTQVPTVPMQLDPPYNWLDGPFQGRIFRHIFTILIKICNHGLQHFSSFGITLHFYLAEICSVSVCFCILPSNTVRLSGERLRDFKNVQIFFPQYRYLQDVFDILLGKFDL